MNESNYNRGKAKQRGMFNAGWKGYLISAVIWIPIFVIVLRGQLLSDLLIFLQVLAFLAFSVTAGAIGKALDKKQ